jgi:hypothetical protein
MELDYVLVCNFSHFSKLTVSDANQPTPRVLDAEFRYLWVLLSAFRSHRRTLVSMGYVCWEF